MNKTLNINLAGMIFHIDENAYQRLERYLTILKSQFSGMEGGSEIISDIEARIGELFKERTTLAKEVISLEDVEEVIAIMGKPEDYLDPEETAYAQPPPGDSYAGRGRRIYRDGDNRIIGGVSAGLAAYFNTDPLWVRLLFILLMFAGPGVIIYIIMWIVIPRATTTAEKLQMRGERVNVSNIERSIREEMRGVEEGARNFSRKAREFDYSKTSRQTGNFFSDLGHFILDALRLIFKFIFKLIGFFFIVIGFIILFAIVVSLFAGGAEFLGSQYTTSHFFEFMRLVTENQAHYSLLMIAIVLTIIAPFFLLIYLGIRILFNLDPLNRPTRGALAFTTFLGLVLLIVAGVRIAIQFDDQSHTEEKVALKGPEVFYLTAQKDSLAARFEADYDTHWIHGEYFDAFNAVDIDIRQATDSVAYLLIERESNGANRREARFHADKIRYEVSLKDSVIELPLYYLLKKNASFRGQEVNVTLFLPPGNSVFIDPSLTEYLYDVKNIQDEWDWEMANKLWIMTDNGLSCEGCNIPEEKARDSTHFQIKGSDEGDDFDMKMNEDGIEIKYKNQQDSGEIRISQLYGDTLLLLGKSHNIVI